MRDCPQIQDTITELVTLQGGEPAWSPAIAEHLRGCPACRDVLKQELELCALLEEPLPLPPAGLISGVMARIAQEQPAQAFEKEPALPWAERFAWAASGAVAMACLDRLPALGTNWWNEILSGFFSITSLWSAPFEINGSYLAALAAVLLAAQGAMVYQVRVSAS